MSSFVFHPNQRAQYDKWCFFKEEMSASECDAILALWNSENNMQARTGTDVDGQPPDLAKRDSRLSWITWKPEIDHVYQRLSSVIRGANDARYGFDLSGFLEDLQLTRYSEGGHYDWHEDSGNGVFSIRKLSFVVQLTDPSEYEGGDFEIFPNMKVPRERGTLVLFPSYVTHKVHPVTKGTRHSLVGWVSGPSFR